MRDYDGLITFIGSFQKRNDSLVLDLFDHECSLTEEGEGRPLPSEVRLFPESGPPGPYPPTPWNKVPESRQDSDTKTVKEEL